MAEVDEKKPNLYRGQEIPLADLSESQFNDFVSEALIILGPQLNIRILSGRSIGSDDGYDGIGERVSDKASVCIQCKRFSSSLNLPSVGEELAKVALSSAVEKSNVKEHYIITTGEVTKTVRSALREADRAKLIEAALNAYNLPENFKELKEKCKLAGIDSEAAIVKHIKNLDTIVVWSGRDFDSQLGQVWLQIEHILEKFFSIDVILREYPRPNYDHKKYFERITSITAEKVDLVAVAHELPPNLERYSTSDPLAKIKGQSNVLAHGTQVVSAIDAVTSVPIGYCGIICGLGGGGKSTTLQMAARIILEKFEEDGVLPIIVRLNRYQNSLDKLIHKELEITYGDWRSLPYKFYFLFDGLDEIPDSNAQSFLDELSQILNAKKSASTLTIRESGLRQTAVLEKFGLSWMLAPLSYRLCFQFAEKVIPKEKQNEFFQQFRSRIYTLGSELLTLPFGFASAVDTFLDSGVLPEESDAFIDEIFNRRIKHNSTRSQNALPKHLHNIPAKTLKSLAEAIAFELRIIRQKTTVDSETAGSIVSTAISNLKAEKLFGTSDISDKDALALTYHYEILIEQSPDVLSPGHDILVDYLAGPRLAKFWRDHKNHLRNVVGQDVWVFASKFVSDHDASEFLETVADVDLVLASRCASKMNKKYHGVVEKRILEADNSESRVYYSRAAISMSILKSDVCLDRLEQRKSEKDENRRYHAERALAIIGDLPMLERLLADNEPMVSSGLTVSGGSFEMWHNAPPILRTEIARQRIDSALITQNELIVLSLRTLSAFGDKSDVKRVESVIAQTANLPTFYAAIDCLFQIDKSRGVAVLREMLIDPKQIPLLYVMEVLSAMSEDFDTSWLLNQLIVFKYQSGEDHQTVEKATKILCAQPLPENGEALLRDAYAGADEYIQASIWEIAQKHRLEAFEELALTELANPKSKKLGYAANFGSKVFLDTQQADKFLELCKKRALEVEPEKKHNNWHAQRLLQAILASGDKSFVAHRVEHVLQKFLPENLRLRKERKASGYKTKVNQQAAEAHYEYFAEFELIFWCPLAKEVKDFLSKDLVKSFVGIDITMSNEEIRQAYVEVVTCLSTEELDLAISQIKESTDRIAIIGRLAHLGKTEARLNTAITDIPEVIDWHLSYSSLIEIIKSYWSDDLAKALINAVAQHNWTSVDGQMFSKVEASVANMVSADQVKKFISPIVSSVTNPFAKEVLTVWQDVALTRRENEDDEE